MFDFLGRELNVGDDCVHVRKCGNTPVFKRVRIVEDSKRGIGIKSSENARVGYTYGKKLIKITE